MGRWSLPNPHLWKTRQRLSIGRHRDLTLKINLQAIWTQRGAPTRAWHLFDAPRCEGDEEIKKKFLDGHPARIWNGAAQYGRRITQQDVARINRANQRRAHARSMGEGCLAVKYGGSGRACVQ